MNRELPVHIERWSAWAPGLNEPYDIERWAAGQIEIATSGVPDVSFLPPLFRRRLSSVCKMALKVAFDCKQDDRNLKSVFCSRHGEHNRTIPLLESIVRGEALSPTAFSLSVHNTASGLYTIAGKETAPSTSLAARLDTFEAGFVEAAASICAGRTKRVMLVYFDEPLDEPFTSMVPYESPFACAFLLTNQTTNTSFSLSMQTRGPDTPVSQEPHGESFVRFLVRQEKRLELVSDRLHWIWNRNA